MALSAQQQEPEYMSETEYLAYERESDNRHEYLNGKVFAMAGASWEHNQIFGTTFASLFAQLRGNPCRVNPSDQRLKVMATGLLTYPDLSVICGEPIFAGGEFDTISNPLVIIEILSPSTEAYDRGEKFQHYREIETLQDYLLISQDKARIERYSKQESGAWLLIDAIGLDTSIELPSISCVLALADVYENVEFGKDEVDDE
jgi:Uma2 family endonuclease